jgi:hypothetical protein
MPKKVRKVKQAKKVKQEKKPRVFTWETLRDHVYARIDFYATRFILISVIGIVVGFIALVYAIIDIAFLSGTLHDITFVLGVMIGVGAIVASLILLVWGMFWRRQVDREKLF